MLIVLKDSGAFNYVISELNKLYKFSVIKKPCHLGQNMDIIADLENMQLYRGEIDELRANTEEIFRKPSDFLNAIHYFY